MAWTSPMTAVSGDLLTASDYNINVRDNFLETAPSYASGNGGFFVVDGTNRIKQRSAGSSSVLLEHQIRICDSVWKEIQSFGPIVTVTTGTRALVTISAELMNGTNNAQTSASFEVSGATRIQASDEWRITHDGHDTKKWTRYSSTRLVTLTPGINTFRMKYRTGNIGPGFFRRREIIVLPM